MCNQRLRACRSAKSALTPRERTWPVGTTRFSSFIDAATARAAAFLMAAAFTGVFTPSRRVSSPADRPAGLSFRWPRQRPAPRPCARRDYAPPAGGGPSIPSSASVSSPLASCPVSPSATCSLITCMMSESSAVASVDRTRVYSTFQPSSACTLSVLNVRSKAQVVRRHHSLRRSARFFCCHVMMTPIVARPPMIRVTHA